MLELDQIGQNVNDPRSTTGTDPENVTTTLNLPNQQFVVPLGGEYFFSPSISALKTKFAAWTLYDGLWLLSPQCISCMINWCITYNNASRPKPTTTLAGVICLWWWVGVVARPGCPYIIWDVCAVVCAYSETMIMMGIFRNEDACKFIFGTVCGPYIYVHCVQPHSLTTHCFSLLRPFGKLRKGCKLERYSYRSQHRCHFNITHLSAACLLRCQIRSISFLWTFSSMFSDSSYRKRSSQCGRSDRVWCTRNTIVANCQLQLG